MELRPATLDDVPALARLGRESFTDAFGHLYRPADLAAFLAETHDEAVVAGEIAGADCRHALAVDADGTLLGYCKLRHPSKLAADSSARDPLELGQLYCAASATGRGVGAALMEWALGEAEAGRHDAMLLSVYSGNAGAQRFYARYGFTKIADIHFRVGEQLDDEYLFEKRLNEGDTA
jgi:ribosomal protein S18 acetylase RimI-like enzyme